MPIGSDNGDVTPDHRIYREHVCPDGYVSTKVPLKSIRFFDAIGLLQRITTGDDQERYTHYSDMVYNGHRPNGVPIVYRNPKGVLFASDLRFSEVALYAELNAKVHPAVPRNEVHPMISVKIIEVSSREDIPAARARYLEAHG